MRTSASKLYMRLALLVAIAGLVLPVVLSRRSSAQSAGGPTAVQEESDLDSPAAHSPMAFSEKNLFSIVKAGGVEIITNGGTEHGATVSSGGTFVAIGSAGFGGDTFRGGSVVEFGSGFKHALSVSANSSNVPVQFIVLSGGSSAAARSRAATW